MKQIFIKNRAGNKLTFLDDKDFEKVINFSKTWYLNKKGNCTYAVSRTNGLRKMFKMHHVILGPRNGRFGDHIDGNGLNNQRSNLRVCDSKGNSQNRGLVSGKKSSKYKGVCYYLPTKSWKAAIKVNSKIIHLGYYKVEKEAAKAYDLAAKENFGEFSKTNKSMGLL